MRTPKRRTRIAIWWGLFALTLCLLAAVAIDAQSAPSAGALLVLASGCLVRGVWTLRDALTKGNRL